MSIKSQSTNIHYQVTIQNPATHYAHISIQLSDIKEKVLHLRMPVWTPGSYLIREFERHVESVMAIAGKTSLEVRKTDKSTWEIINKSGHKQIEISYRVYCFESSVRTSFIDADHAFLLPTSCLMYTDYMGQGSINFDYPATWAKLSTTLTETGPKQYSFESYDELADTPFEIGNHIELGFEVAGVPHQVAIVGENNCSLDKFVADLKKICTGMFDVMKVHPCKNYLFIVHHVDEGGGGLEHANSNVVQMPRFGYSDKARYTAFLSLCAHEYFHLWNVKRIRPIELGPFDYSKENHSELLWVAEGITSYYDELIMYRCGFKTQAEYLKTLSKTFNSTLNRKGAEIQSMHASSFDAWIKEYRPNENSFNTGISYYTKGTVLAALLDIELLSATAGKNGLDQLMQYLYQTFYIKKQRGFSNNEFYEAIDVVAGKALGFRSWAESPNSSDINDRITSIFKKTACTIKNQASENPYYTGIYTEIKGDKVFVKSIEAQSPSYGADIQSGDELLAVNNLRVKNGIDDLIKIAGATEVNLLLSRNGLIRTVNIQCIVSPKLELEISINSTDDKILKAWLKK